LIFVFGSFVKSAANEIFVKDTTLSRLYPAIIRIQGKLDNSADSVKITLKYDANQLNIIDVFSDENNIFMEPELSYYKWGTDPKDYDLVITSKKINPKGKYFCNIKLRALICQDTIFRLNPVYLQVNAKKADAEFTAGNFLVKNPITVTNKSEIGYFYPNPFDYESKIEFTLLEDAFVDIKIYDSFGLLEKTVEKNYLSPEIIFINSANTIFQFNPEEKLPKGRYYMNWQPRRGFWGSDAYFILFKIGNELYSTKVIYTK
jgi:hypothetical protein